MKKRFSLLFTLICLLPVFAIGVWIHKPYPVLFVDEGQAEMLAMDKFREDCQRHPPQQSQDCWPLKATFAPEPRNDNPYEGWLIDVQTANQYYQQRFWVSRLGQVDEAGGPSGYEDIRPDPRPKIPGDETP